MKTSSATPSGKARGSRANDAGLSLYGLNPGLREHPGRLLRYANVTATVYGRPNHEAAAGRLEAPSGGFGA
jgi:hypothetical protein